MKNEINDRPIPYAFPNPDPFIGSAKSLHAGKWRTSRYWHVSRGKKLLGVCLYRVGALELYNALNNAEVRAQTAERIAIGRAVEQTASALRVKEPGNSYGSAKIETEWGRARRILGEAVADYLEAGGFAGYGIDDCPDNPEMSNITHTIRDEIQGSEIIDESALLKKALAELADIFRSPEGLLMGGELN